MYSILPLANLHTRGTILESQDLTQYLQPTPLLDYQASPIQALVVEKGWENLSTKTAQIEAVYTYVRDEIAYGFTSRFQIPASQVLSSKQGNCITKTTLLMALLRRLGIPCRLRAGWWRKSFTADYCMA
ncbi:MAG: transglutaminase domain-containing protein [Spirochaetia bacterium]|nr:transglutaminase domain-containing protein [Spirochaetia bacterium]